MGKSRRDDWYRHAATTYTLFMLVWREKQIKKEKQFLDGKSREGNNPSYFHSCSVKETRGNSNTR